jgi:hypothetical protein
MYRYLVVEVSRKDPEKMEEVLREHGRSSWDLVQAVEGSSADPADRSMLTLFFRRSATDDIGV